MAAKGRGQAGFTLLEVVVAMAIVGLGVVTLLEVFSSGLRLGARSGARTEALAYGRQIMDEALIDRRGEGGGEGAIGERLSWRLEARPLSQENLFSSSGGWELEEVTLQVRYREGERERSIEMRTLRLLKKKGP